MNLAKMLLAVAAPFLLAAAAHADPTSLATPPLETVGGGGVSCAVVNVSDQTRAVKIQILLGNAGIPLLDEQDFELAPKQAAQLFLLDVCSNGGCGFYYCEFKVQGPKRAYRATLCVDDVADKVCLPAE